MHRRCHNLYDHGIHSRSQSQYFKFHWHESYCSSSCHLSGILSGNCLHGIDGKSSVCPFCRNGSECLFAYTVCGNMGYPWQAALLAVFIEGLIFIILSVTNIREALFNVIPLSLKKQFLWESAFTLHLSVCKMPALL